MARVAKGKERENSRSEMRSSGSVIETLANVVGVLRSYWKLVLALALGLSLMLVGLLFLIPVQYSKSVNLSVTPTVSELQTRVGQGPLDATQAANQAVSFLDQGSFGPVTVSPTYDPETQQIEVQVESENRRALTDIEQDLTKTVEDGFRATYEGSLGTAVESQLSAARAQVKANEAAVADVERQIQEVQPVDPTDTAAVVRLTVLEGERLDLQETQAPAEANRDFFEQAQSNLPELAAEPIAVEVAQESGIARANLRLPAAVFAVFLSFVVATVVALRVAAVRKG